MGVVNATPMPRHEEWRGLVVAGCAGVRLTRRVARGVSPFKRGGLLSAPIGVCATQATGPRPALARQPSMLVPVRPSRPFRLSLVRVMVQAEVQTEVQTRVCVCE